MGYHWRHPQDGTGTEDAGCDRKFYYEAIPGEDIGFDEDDDAREDVEIIDLIEDNDRPVDQIDDDSSNDVEEEDDEQIEEIDQGAHVDIVRRNDEQTIIEDVANGAAAAELIYSKMNRR